MLSMVSSGGGVGSCGRILALLGGGRVMVRASIGHHPIVLRGVPPSARSRRGSGGTTAYY